MSDKKLKLVLYNNISLNMTIYISSETELQQDFIFNLNDSELRIFTAIFLCPGSRRSSDQLDLMVDGLPVSLPSYEEAVYGSWGQRLPACSAPGPTQLLLAQEAPSCHQSSQSDGSHHPLLSSQSPDNLPPPYEEVQSSHPSDRMSDGDIRQLNVALPDDKDT